MLHQTLVLDNLDLSWQVICKLNNIQVWAQKKVRWKQGSKYISPVISQH